MSLYEFIPENIDLIVFVVATLAVLISSYMVIKHKSLIYAAFFLSVLGMSNAMFFALLGYPFIALFHVAVYVGAAVTFIMFSITMFSEVGPVEIRAGYLALISSALLALALAVIFYTSWNTPLKIVPVSYVEMAGYFLRSYWFPILIATLALVTTLIEAITLARREVRR